MVAAIALSPLACTKKGEDEAKTREKTCQAISDQVLQQAEMAVTMIGMMADDDEDSAELAAEAKAEMKAMAAKMSKLIAANSPIH